jgi:hypothetical protein
MTYSGKFKNKVTFKVTNNNEYLEGKLYSNFNSVHFITQDDPKEEEMELQKEFLEYYFAAPVNNLAGVW